MLMRQFEPQIPPFGRQFFRRARLKKPVSIRAPDSTIRASNWQFPETSISSILSHFYNIFESIKLIPICFGWCRVELIMFQNWFYLKLWFIVFYSRIDFHTHIYGSRHFYKKLFKHKSLLLHITFNQNQFYIINSIKIDSSHRTTRHT